MNAGAQTELVWQQDYPKSFEINARKKTRV